MACITYVRYDDIVGNLVRQTLTEISHVIVVIGRGLIAFETIVFKQPDHIKLDRTLPGMKGLEIVRRVRTIPDFYFTPVVMLTADGSAEAVDFTRKGGVNEYVAKPLTRPDLIKRIQAVPLNFFYRSKISSPVLRPPPAAPADLVSHLNAANPPWPVTAI